MASLSDFGFSPESPDSERRRARRERSEESGARPLPSDYYEDYDADPLDEEVVLPGVSPRAGLSFGIGAGVGVAALAILGGLYFGGYIDRPALPAGPEATPLRADLTPFEDWLNVEALANARIATVERSAARAFAPTTLLESPDIQVIEEDTRAPHPVSPNPMPAMPEPDTTTPRTPVPVLKAPEMPPPPAGAAPEPEPLPPPAEPTAPAEPSTPQNPY